VCDLSPLSISILQRSAEEFTRALQKDAINEFSRVNGLGPLHFAIYWPWALEQLIDAGADIHCEDNWGRRPIHLAVACRQVTPSKHYFRLIVHYSPLNIHGVYFRNA
jgi:hypothetical protein